MGNNKKKTRRRKRPDTSALFNAAINSYNNGQADEAQKLLTKVIQSDSSHADAFNLLGILQCQEGGYQKAVISFTKACRIDPSNPQYYNNLGIAYSDYGDQESAIRHYEKALMINPDFLDAAYNLGIALNDSGFPEKAAICYKGVIEKKPDYIKAYNNIGSVLLTLGKPEEAIVYYNEAISLNPGFVEVYNNLGNAFHILMRPEESIKHYQKVIELNPTIADVYSNLGGALVDIGNNEDACLYYQKGIQLDPGDKNCWQGLADTLALSNRHTHHASFSSLLSQCLTQTGINKQNLSTTIIEYLKTDPATSNYIKSFNHLRDEQLDAIIKTGDLFSFVSTPLLINFLKTLFVTDQVIETFLTQIRKSLLSLCVTNQTDETFMKKGIDFAAALAHQGFINDYVFFQTDCEIEQVELLQNRLAQSKLFQDMRACFNILVIGMYKPLYSIIKDQKLIPENTYVSRPCIAGVIKQHIVEPLEEESLKPGFDTLTKIENKTSQSVRAQYEENPYPRWIDVPCFIPMPFSIRMKKISDSLNDDVFFIPSNPEILIAGCGTGSQALHAAAHFPSSSITAIDLSLSSLAYAARKAIEVKNKSINFFQGDILDVELLDKQFDIVECTGVLHHMKDPLQGWKNLTARLKPDGFMFIGLYSDSARRHITEARDFIKKNKYTSDPQGIRACRKKLFAQPEGSLLRSVVLTKDYYNLSTCRDLLFHVQEYCYSLPEISSILTDLGLDFIGFEFGKNAGAVLKSFKARFPENGSAAQLSLWNRYEEENPHTFSRMYQFWVRKKR